MGIKSQAYGSLYENIFKQACQRQGIGVTRIPDSCRQMRNQIIRVKSPFDWIISYKERAAFIDTKTSQGETLAYSAINPHQIVHLMDHDQCGIHSGYVIWLRKPNIHLFIPTKALVLALGKRGSFSSQHPMAVFLGQDQFNLRMIWKNAVNMTAPTQPLPNESTAHPPALPSPR